MDPFRKFEIFPFKGSPERSFGVVFSVFFFVVALWPLLHGYLPRIWALGLTIAILVLTLLWPAALNLPNRLWLKFGLLLHSIVSPIALGILFYGMFTPMGLIMRLFGKRPLTLSFDRKASSYWIRREPQGAAPDSMINQF
jgi:hypothetical protein